MSLKEKRRRDIPDWILVPIVYAILGCWLIFALFLIWTWITSLVGLTFRLLF